MIRKQCCAIRGEKRGHGIPAAARNLRCVSLRERRAELAWGEIFQGAEASVEVGGRQAPLAACGAGF